MKLYFHPGCGEDFHEWKANVTQMTGTNTESPGTHNENESSPFEQRRSLSHLDRYTSLHSPRKVVLASFKNTHPASLRRSRKAWNLVKELSMLSRTASSSRALIAGGADAEPVAASASVRERLVSRRRAFSNSNWREMRKRHGRKQHLEASLLSVYLQTSLYNVCIMQYWNLDLWASITSKCIRSMYDCMWVLRHCKNNHSSKRKFSLTLTPDNKHFS